jgi:hypothetical protein
LLVGRIASQHVYMLGLVVFLVTVAVAVGAVIEVTAGGTSPPTYLFSDEVGVGIANLTATSNGSITASGDLKTGAGNGMDDLATRLAVAESIIQQQATHIANLTARLDFLDARVLLTSGGYLGCSSCSGGPVHQVFTGGFTTLYGEEGATYTTDAACAQACMQDSNCDAWLKCSANGCWRTSLNTGGTPTYGCSSSAIGSCYGGIKQTAVASRGLTASLHSSCGSSLTGPTHG